MTSLRPLISVLYCTKLSLSFWSSFFIPTFFLCFFQLVSFVFLIIIVNHDDSIRKHCKSHDVSAINIVCNGNKYLKSYSRLGIHLHFLQRNKLLSLCFLCIFYLLRMLFSFFCSPALYIWKFNVVTMCKVCTISIFSERKNWKKLCQRTCLQFVGLFRWK